jgi:hypothetical protein
VTNTTDAKLRELAEKATPGPWQRSGVRQTITENCIMVGPDSFLIIAVPVGKNPKEHAGAFCDAGYIAACDPQTILSLLDRLSGESALKARVEELEREMAELIVAVEAEVNEKGAGGFLLARLSDARNLLKEASRG